MASEIKEMGYTDAKYGVPTAAYARQQLFTCSLQQSRKEPALYQFFSKPDIFLAPCGDLRCRVAEHRVPGAPAFMRGLRALFVTDVHALPRTTGEDMDALTAKIASVHADILLFGGDYADKPEPARRLFAHFRNLHVPLGAYAVLGNNDREAFPDPDDLRRALWPCGIELLVNESRTIKLKGGRLVIAGLDEYRRGNPDPSGLYPEESRSDCYRILLSHYPRAVDPMPDLMLSGHTHGGQFNCLGVTPYTIGFERLLAFRLASRYVEGLHEYRGGRMLVGKGIGASRIPLRIGVRPEIDLIVFD